MGNWIRDHLIKYYMNNALVPKLPALWHITSFSHKFYDISTIFLNHLKSWFYIVVHHFELYCLTFYIVVHHCELYCLLQAGPTVQVSGVHRAPQSFTVNSCNIVESLWSSTCSDISRSRRMTASSSPPPVITNIYLRSLERAKLSPV